MNSELPAVRQGTLRPGDHVCWSYGDPDTFNRGLCQFVRDGLARNEQVLCHLSIDHFEEAERALVTAVPEARDAIRSGAVTLAMTRDSYLVQGRFDPQLRLDDIAALAARARSDGFTALRLLLNASDLKGNPSVLTAWPGCELRTDFVIARHNATLVCAYDARQCRGDTIDLLRAVHPTGVGLAARPRMFGMHRAPTSGLALHGEIDVTCADHVATLGPEAVPEIADGAVDVSDLRFIDVAGMRALLGILEAMVARHRVVRVRGASPMFRRLWDLMGFDSRVNVCFEAAGR